MSEYIYAIIFVLGLCSGIFIDHEVNQAKLTGVETHDAKDLGKGEAKIIKENQAIDKELKNDKDDPCLNDKLPIDYD